MDLENQYGTLEIQKALLDLLKEFNSFCQDNTIEYSLAGGSLLGAIRHKGFIPWDDDLDVVVNRSNYEKILQSIGCNNQLIIERITQACLWTDRVRFRNKHFNSLSYQPTIDIFILDNTPDNRIKSLIKRIMIYCLQGMIKYKLSMKKGSLLMKLCAFITFIIGRLFSHEQKYKWYHRVSQWGNKRPSEFCSCYNGLFSSIPLKFHAFTLTSFVYAQFEDSIMPITSDFDFYLRVCYGDYMTPPERSDRKPIHS